MALATLTNADRRKQGAWRPLCTGVPPDGDERTAHRLWLIASAWGPEPVSAARFYPDMSRTLSPRCAICRSGAKREFRASCSNITKYFKTDTEEH